MKASSLTRILQNRLRTIAIVASLAVCLILAAHYLVNLDSGPEPTCFDRWKIPSVHASVSADDEISAGTHSTLTTVSLPDIWQNSRPNFQGEITYRFSPIINSQDASDRALYIPRISQQGRIQVNGHILFNDIYNGDTQSRRWYMPLLLNIPSDFLKTGPNEIEITVAGNSSKRAGLSAIYFGPEAQLAAIEFWRYVTQVFLPPSVAILIIGLGLLHLLFWLRDPSGAAVYGFFGIGAALYGLRSLHPQITHLPLPEAIWMPLVSLSLGLSLAFIWVSLTRFHYQRNRYFERAIWSINIVGGIALFLIPHDQFVPVSSWTWYLPQLLIGATCLSILMSRAFKDPNWPTWIIIAGIISQFPFGIHDFIWQSNPLAFTYVLLMPLTFPIMLAVIGIVLADDIAKQRYRFSKQNELLMEMGADAKVELERLYKEAHQRDILLAGASERNRLMQDMHDGVGTQLAMLFASLKSGEMTINEATEAVADSLADLHLIVDVRATDPATLSDVLSNFRYRLDTRVRPLGVETQYEIDDQIEHVVLPPQTTLNILRVLQECCANAIKHAKPKLIKLRAEINLATESRSEILVLEIVNDGTKSGPLQRVERGRGLINVAARATSMSGHFELIKKTELVCARLSLPLNSDHKLIAQAAGS